MIPMPSIIFVTFLFIFVKKRVFIILLGIGMARYVVLTKLKRKTPDCDLVRHKSIPHFYLQVSRVFPYMPGFAKKVTFLTG
jgi:hypothetical protein